ncbi:MAG: alkaline phosphatase D family protein [Oceanicaulis sp.]
MKNEFRPTRRTALLGAAGLGAALAACSEQRFEPLPRPAGPFQYGVASGDPGPDSVVLWTAVTRADGPVTVEVSETPDFAALVFTEEVRRAGPPVDEATPFKIVATGLEPGRPVWYRFRFREHLSSAGRTKPLPAGPVDRFTIAAFSCSNYPAGFFNAYAHAAQRGDLDLAVHLGDYIYEYGQDGFGTEDAERLSRRPDPAHETVSYADYARRHAQYSSDPDLQALKAAAPLLMIWDDHETTNDSWKGGAENHDAGEGVWTERRDAAIAAWAAWTPSRERPVAHERWGALEIGDLATLIFLETRLTARDEQVSLAEFPVDPATADPEDPQARAAVADWLQRTAGDPDRRLLGERQLAFVEAALGASVEAGKPWRVFANQVIMGRVPAPNYPKVMPFWLRWAIRSSDPLAWSFIERFAFGMPLNLDAWDGYAAERERLYAAARAANADFITITGDTHNAWVLDLHDEGGARVGTEFGVTSVTSPSRFERLDLPTVDFGRYTEEAAPEVLRHNAYDRGYMMLTLTPDEATAEHVVMSTVKSRDYAASPDSVWRLRPARGGEVPQVERIA